MPTQSILHDVIGYNERSGVKNPEEHRIDFFIDEALFEKSQTETNPYAPMR